MLGCPFCNAEVTKIFTSELDYCGRAIVTIQTKCECFLGEWLFSAKGTRREVEIKAIAAWEQRAESIYEYARKCSLDLKIKKEGPAFLVWFDGLKNNEYGFVYGHGTSRREAINDFIDKISGNTLTGGGRELKVPRLIKL